MEITSTQRHLPLSSIQALWSYRGFVVANARREVVGRYTGSILGSTWNLVHPLVSVLIYTLVFTEVMRARLPGVDDTLAYGVFICAGILMWGLFAEIANRMTNVFVENANLIKKASFPRICLPATVALSAIANYALLLTLVCAFLVVTGRFPGWPVLWIVPLTLVTLGTAIGLGMTAGVLQVFFRDIGSIISIGLQLWFWLTPIVYPLQAVPEGIRQAIAFNPLAGLARAYQDVFLFGSTPQWSGVVPAAALAIATLALALVLYRRHAAELADEL